MFLARRSRLARIAIIAAITTTLNGTAFAQPVRVFDDAPSIEQLRSIIIPESQPGATRSIVFSGPGMSTPSANLQGAATQMSPTLQTPVVTPDAVPPPAARLASNKTVLPRLSAPKSNPAAGAVAFRVNFAFDSALLPDSARSMIGMIAQLMKEAPQIEIRVEGHTDAAGSANYNTSLSERRALSVGEYLVKLGVEPTRLILVGKGMTEPLTRDPYDGVNRRVQFVRVS